MHLAWIMEANMWVVSLTYWMHILNRESTRILASNKGALWDLHKWSIVIFLLTAPQFTSGWKEAKVYNRLVIAWFKLMSQWLFCCLITTCCQMTSSKRQSIRLCCWNIQFSLINTTRTTESLLQTCFYTHFNIFMLYPNMLRQKFEFWTFFDESWKICHLHAFAKINVSNVGLKCT